MAKESTLELRELLSNPGTAPFSRIKYIPRLASDEQIKEFINGLFLAAVESKHENAWGKLSDFLERWDDLGIGLQFEGLAIPEFESIPWAALTKPLAECKVALVTTGGVFIEGERPFEQRGDATYRRIHRDVPRDLIRIWHPGYDTAPATKDINCVFPLDRFKELEEEGAIHELAETNYSFMGLIPDPETLINETAPQVARELKEDGVDAAFLAST